MFHGWLMVYELMIFWECEYEKWTKFIGIPVQAHTPSMHFETESE